MPHHDIVTITGTVTYIFKHRFVVETANGAVLADVTPHGLENISLKVGNKVELTGEMKPSELKVTRFTSGGGKTIEIEHKKKHDDDHPPADPAKALKAARDAGFEIVGEPRRKPKHFEVLGRRDKELTELHVELDGSIRKTKPADRDDPKWQDAMRHA